MRLIAVLVAALSSIAYAQQQQQTPEIRALTIRIGQEINANIQCSAANIDLQDKLKALKDKYEKDQPDK